MSKKVFPAAPTPSPESGQPVSADKRVFGGLKSLRLALAEEDLEAIERRARRLVHGHENDPEELRGEMITERGDSAFMVAAWRAPFSRDAIALAEAGADTGRRNELGLSVFMSMARDSWRRVKTISELASFLTRYHPDPKTPDQDVPDPFFSSRSVPPHIEGFLRYPTELLTELREWDAMTLVARHIAACHRVSDLEQWWMIVQRSDSQLPRDAFGRSDLWGEIVTDQVRALLNTDGPLDDLSSNSVAPLPATANKRRL